jgi:flagellar biosynthesis protein FlhF
MNPEKFRGKDLTSALRAVREALGPDPLIFDTHAVSDLKGDGVEIMAVAERPIALALPVLTAAPEAPETSGVEEVRDEIASLRSMLGWLAPKLSHKSKILQNLSSQGLEAAAIERISEAMETADASDDREKLYQAIKCVIQSGGQIEDTVERLALVGPTGVGKTTSIIKLSVFEAQKVHRRIGWINTDARSFAGADPMALYAGILNVRYETAESRTDFLRALDRLSDCDLVLIDTLGVNPRNQREVNRLATLFEGLSQIRRTLLCPAATNGADLADWVQAFKPLNFGSLFFTKLDECRHYGVFVNTAITTACPLSYLSLGQNMAGDLAIATADILTSFLLGEVDGNR